MLRAHGQLVHRLGVLSDLAIIASAVVLANVHQSWSSVSLAQSTFIVADPRVRFTHLAGQIAVLALAWLVFTDRFDFYRSRRTQSVSAIFFSICETWLVAMGAGLVVSSLVWGRYAFSPAMLFVLVLGGISCVRLGMLSALQRLRSRGVNFRRFLVVGDGRGAERVVATSTSNQQFGMQALGFVPFPGEAGSPDGVEKVGEFEDLRTCIADALVDCVVVCPPQRATTGQIESVFRTCDEAGIPCQYVPNYLSAKHLHMRSGWWGEIPLLYFASQPYAPFKHGTKRALDILIAAGFLLVLAPLFAVIALAIRLGDRGPIFHRQTRVGLNGRLFTILKFRTMVVNAEALRAQVAHLNEEDGPVFKARHDPRITRAGRWLRKYSLDELPQLINVLRGDMSIVGPRPPIPDEVAKYDWWQRRRIAVRPGLTCIWQVWGRNKVPFRRWMEMDLYYVDHWSLWMDLKLIVRTLGVVVRGTGS